MFARVVGLALGYALDRRFGDPQSFHPVAGVGRVAGALERRMYADDVPTGVAYSAALVGGGATLAAAVEHRLARRPILRTLATAAATWAVLGGRSLGREASAVGVLLADDDLPGARQRLTHLVGRDTTQLDEAEISRAVVESVAENTSDAVVAPLFWGGLLGLPGLVGYRIANTLDAMVGHRSARYERFGKVSARLDDALNLAPARLSGVLGSAFAPMVGGSPSDAWRTVRRDAAGHPSPNAGQVESAFAGALGVRLGGTNVYGTRVEERPVMGDGRPVAREDIPRATKLADAVGLGALVVSVVLVALRTGRRASSRR